MYNVLTFEPAQTPDSVKQALQNLLQNKSVGFTQIPQRSELFESSAKLAATIKKDFSQVLVVGIGGSSMGSRAVAEISGAEHIYFLDNVDSVELMRLWKKLAIDLKKTAFLFVSKSGSTIEILWNYSTLEMLAREIGADLSAQSFFISEDNGNPIATLAREKGRPLLSVPADIGGRFSVLTPVGLVVAALAGMDLQAIQTGAAAALADQSAVTAACSHYLESFKRREVITLFWFYNSAYRWFGQWVQQLWAESLGKKDDLNGKPAPGFSTPMTAIGACDQHSVLQQVAHGSKNKFVCFFNFKSVENSSLKMKSFSFGGHDFALGKNYGALIASQEQATRDALKQTGVSTVSHSVNDENASYTLGYLFMYFQLVVAVLGLHENINPFDQPGVLLGKELALKKLKTD